MVELPLGLAPPQWIVCVVPVSWCVVVDVGCALPLWWQKCHPHTLDISWGMCGRAKGLDFELFHKHIGIEGANGGCHGHTTYLFIILTLEEKVYVLRQNSRTVTVCCMDMLVLLGKCWVWCNFCLTMLMEGSKGNVVKRLLTLYDTRGIWQNFWWQAQGKP